MTKTLLERFSKKNYKKWIEKSLWLKKNKEKNVKNYMQIGNVTVGLIEKKLLYKMSYFPELKKKIKVEVDLINCTRKSDLKNTTAVDIWKVSKEGWFSYL